MNVLFLLSTCAFDLWGYQKPFQVDNNRWPPDGQSPKWEMGPAVESLHLQRDASVMQSAGPWIRVYSGAITRIIFRGHHQDLTRGATTKIQLRDHFQDYTQGPQPELYTEDTTRIYSGATSRIILSGHHQD